MKSNLYFLLLVLFLNACAFSPKKATLETSGDFPPPGAVVERTENLGSGFKRVSLAEPVRASFESIGHFSYLYYGKQRLCQLGDCSVSPSGKYAIYQDGPSGNFFLYHPSDHSLTQLTSSFVGLADTFEWHEDAKTVDVNFNSGWKSKRTFSMP